jgi:transcriptional regulator with XRE-family HTH domain
MLQKKLGQRIAALRKTRQLTQTELAKKVGCSVEFISLVERGVNAPSVAGLETFAKVLRVGVADLFTFSRRKRSRKPRPAKRTLPM